MIEIKHLRKSWPNATPLKDVNTVINEGDIISIIGPSGTGKSTLIRCINLLETPTSGEIIVDGECITKKGFDISRVRKKMGMVFQSFNLFEHLTVIENIMIPQMDLLGRSKQEAYDKAMSLLHKVGLEKRALNYPDMLSGGQKQRVAIARTLSMDPEIIMFDEPTSALDPTMIGEVEAVIRSLAKMGKTMMIVTHEMRFAKSICNRVFYMDQGGIYEDGTPEQIFEHPQRERTRRFVYHLKVFETVIEDKEFDFIGNISAMDKYGYKNQISAKTIYRIQSVFEELCGQILLPKLDSPKIFFTVEYDENAERATAVVLYNGDIFNPLDSDNDIAVKILENVSRSIEHSTVENDEEYTNKVVIEIK